ncbi:PEP-CTERM sorting domain-containing protein [Vibrio nitrifigilis]|uniref:PEP-CTERM sorting domain-containing protein n=1 Tax=Vibrio nitrifigilis TaxID=2789781 RepID=A0ABS0GKV4_9VIBR|nr:PEP-CTERM sorting domain-containing protein [Vibrio nitrifigilis]MBF9003104.1 PEP-CTERM sorting domain-containing protein [Vibrio nitrifigilis]
MFKTLTIAACLSIAGMANATSCDSRSPLFDQYYQPHQTESSVTTTSVSITNSDNNMPSNHRQFWSQSDREQAFNAIDQGERVIPTDNAWACGHDQPRTVSTSTLSFPSIPHRDFPPMHRPHPHVTPVSDPDTQTVETPEPGTLGTMLLGLVLCGFIVRQRKHRGNNPSLSLASM